MALLMTKTAIARREWRKKRWLADPEKARAIEAGYRKRTRSKPGFIKWQAGATKAYYRKHREWRSLNIRLRAYGLTLDQYHAMLESQDFLCAICRTEDIGRRNTRMLLYIDHDHSTDYVRGLLCHGCNDGLGKFRDNLVNLRAAITYLERSFQRQVQHGLRLVA